MLPVSFAATPMLLLGGATMRHDALPLGQFDLIVVLRNDRPTVADQAGQLRIEFDAGTEQPLSPEPIHFRSKNHVVADRPARTQIFSKRIPERKRRIIAVAPHLSEMQEDAGTKTVPTPLLNDQNDRFPNIEVILSEE